MTFKRKLAQHVKHSFEDFINLSNVKIRNFQSSIDIVYNHNKTFNS